MQVTPGGRSFTATARRAQIVAATIDTLAELGYGQTTFARIAERAQLSSTRLISYHFAGKDELMSAVVSDVLGRLDRFLAERLAGRPDARHELAAYITGMIDFIAGHRAPMRALMSISLHARDATGGALGRVQDILRRGQAGGEFRAFDTFVMAATVQRSVDGLPFLLRTEPDLDLPGYARELVTLFDLATRRDPRSTS